MQTKFMLNGTQVSVIKLNEDQLLDKLPSRIYSLQHNTFTGFYLETVKDQLEMPETIYGGPVLRADKCIKAYRERPMSTGILLTGDKGTGKTLLMSVLANKAVTELDLPVILIKAAYAGTEFITFIETIGECVLVFDEFGKMYASNERHSNENDVPQTSLLSLMDGVDKTKRMFILAENSEIDINEFMLNRPSRIYYHFRYKKLDEASVTGYCKDNDVDKETVTDIIELSRRSKIFSFDMLQSIVEEHLRFGCSVEDATSDLNIDTREARGAMMEVIKIVDRKTNEERKIFGTSHVVKPSSDNYVYIKVTNEEEYVPSKNSVAKVREEITGMMDDDESYTDVYVRDSDLAYEKNNQLVYETEEYTFVCNAIETPVSKYWELF